MRVGDRVIRFTTRVMVNLMPDAYITIVDFPVLSQGSGQNNKTCW